MGDEELELVSQSGLREEEFFRSSGVRDEMLVVVKAHKFRLEFAASKGLTLGQYRWEGQLVYDNDERKPVPVVKVAPLTVGVKCAGNVINAKCSLAVLSSQHEGSLFRVVVTGLSKSGPKLHGVSGPIRVISKPDGGGPKRRKGEDGEMVDEDDEPGSGVPERKTVRTTAAAAEAKLTGAEELLAEVSQLQMSMQELLRKLQHYDSLSAAENDGNQAQDDPQHQQQQQQQQQRDRKPLDFRHAFTDVVEAYGRIVGEAERKRRMQHVVSLLPSVVHIQQMRDLARGPSSGLADDMASGGIGGAAAAAAGGAGGGGGGGAASFMPPSLKSSTGIVAFNDLFVPVSPAPFVSTTVTIDGFNFDLLDFGETAGCTCTNCNYKQEAERMDKFASEAGILRDADDD